MSLAGAALSQPVAQAALAGALGGIAQSPLARAAVRYWWLTLPVGYVAWDAYQASKERGGKVRVSTVVAQMSPAIMLLASVVMLNHTLRCAEAEARANGALPAVPPVNGIDESKIRDATFTQMRLPAKV